jgi:beta-xylosidase
MDKLASEGRSWTHKDPWAPAVVARNDKYYFYFSADHYFGIAEGDSPEGPFQDAVGHTMYDRWDGIDPMTFIDDDSEAYVFFGYGGQFGGMAVGILNPDMISWKEPPVIIEHNTNGLVNYLEGPFMFKRNGIYYLTYSNDNWQTPEYNVQYCLADHPLGPYEHKGRILEKDENHVGPGHHSILQIPGRDQWYIIYHRYSNTQTTNGVPRTTHIDTLRFNEDGTIQDVIMTDTGVHAVNLAEVLSTGTDPGKSAAVMRETWPVTLYTSAGARGLHVQACTVSGQLEIRNTKGALVLRYDIRRGPAASITWYLYGSAV